jgi:hypothetical protein
MDPIDMSRVNLRKETRPEASGFIIIGNGSKYPGFLKKKHFPELILSGFNHFMADVTLLCFSLHRS